MAKLEPKLSPQGIPEIAQLHGFMPLKVAPAKAGTKAPPTVRYDGIWRAGTDGHYLWAGVDWQNFEAKWQELSKQNLRLIDIDVYEEGGISKFIGVWRAGTDGHYLWAGVGWQNFEAKWQELSKQNLRLVAIKTYLENNVRKYIGVWRQGSDGHFLWAGVDWQNFEAKWQELAKQNLRLTDVETYVENGTRKYIGVWRAGTDGHYLWAGVDWKNLVAKWQELAPQNLRLIDLTSYVADGTRKYIGVWRGGTDGYALYGGLGWDDFVAQWTAQAKHNQRLIRVERYEFEPQWQKFFHDSLSGKAIGYAYAVVKGGQVVHSGAGGYARAPWEATNPGVQFTANTAMPIASVSKSITALAVMKLLQANFSLLDTPFYPYLSSRWSKPGKGVNTVTLRNLLSMKSGMKQQGSLFGDYNSTMQAMISADLVGTPGVTDDYNNGNFGLLQAIVEALSGHGYADYVKQNIFAPMGITQMTAATAPQASGVLSYKKGATSGAGAWWPTLTSSTACGGWNGSVLDLGKFLIGVRKHQVLSAAATEKMFNERLGWYQFNGVYGEYFHHNGILYTGPKGQGLTTGIVQLADDTAAVLFINTWDFSTIDLIIQAFDQHRA